MRYIAYAVVLAAAIAVGAYAYAQTPQTESPSGDWSACMRAWDNMTPEQKEQYEQRKEEWKTQMQAMMTEMDQAVEAGYDQWVAVVQKYMGNDAPILQKVNRENFPMLQEAHRDMMRAHATLEEMGIDMMDMMEWKKDWMKSTWKDNMPTQPAL